MGVQRMGRGQRKAQVEVGHKLRQIGIGELWTGKPLQMQLFDQLILQRWLTPSTRPMACGQLAQMISSPT